jgi:hypothetical protein
MKRYGYEKKQEVIQLTAHQKKLAFGNFHYMLEALEEYVKKTGYYPNFKSQLHRKTIADSNDTLEGFEDLFLTQLFIFKAAVGNKPEYLRKEIREEYYKWINATGIDANNCPEKLKKFLFEVNEVLEGRGEEFAELTKQKFDDGKEVDSKDLLGMFGSIQQPLNRVREQGKSLEGKVDKEADVERFDANLEQGEKSFKKIAGGVSSRHTYQKSNFQQRTNSEIVQDVVQNPSNWRIDEIITEYDNLGRAKKRENALIHKLAEVGYDGSVLGDNQPVYLAQRFSPREIEQINRALGVSRTSSSSTSSQKYYFRVSPQSSSLSVGNKSSGKSKEFSIIIVGIVGVIFSAIAIRKYFQKQKIKKVR